MGKINMLGLAAALALVLPVPYAAAAQEIQGQVVSMARTKDCPAEGACAADVGLRTTSGKVMRFHLRPDTEITRGGKLIPLSQLSLGDTVAVPAYDAITTEMRTVKPVLFD